MVAVPGEARKFRFAAAIEGSRDEGGARKLISLAQTAEELGYDTVALPDHFGEQVGPMAALGALSQSTDKIRLATTVLANGYRHPAVVAKEATTVDVLSRGRLELGIGAGGLADEFAKTGIEFESPGARLRKLAESLTILDGLLRGDEVTFEGEFYRVEGLEGYPRPRQGPRPPIAIAAGSPKMLELAAQRADIISVAASAAGNGKVKLSDMTMERTAARVDRIRAAAGERFADIELGWTIISAVITDDREAMAEMTLGALASGFPPHVEQDVTLTVDDILSSPYLAFGSAQEIADQMVDVRERTGMSYIGIFPGQMESFAPVLSLLKGR